MWVNVLSIWQLSEDKTLPRCRFSQKFPRVILTFLCHLRIVHLIVAVTVLHFTEEEMFFFAGVLTVNTYRPLAKWFTVYLFLSWCSMLWIKIKVWGGKYISVPQLDDSALSSEVSLNPHRLGGSVLQLRMTLDLCLCWKGHNRKHQPPHRDLHRSSVNNGIVPSSKCHVHLQSLLMPNTKRRIKWYLLISFKFYSVFYFFWVSCTLIKDYRSTSWSLTNGNVSVNKCETQILFLKITHSEL